MSQQQSPPSTTSASAGGSPASDDASPDARQPTIRFFGGPALSALPIALFIVWAIVQTVGLRISDTTGLVAGMLISLIVGMLLVRGSWTPYANALFEGMTQRVVVTAIVAWLWAGMFAATLQVGGFVEGLAWLANALGVGPALLPAVTFLAAAVLATGIGTGYGTTIAFVALFFPAGVALGADPVLMFGSILSGAVFGDNLAPVSDTTIVSAITQESDIGGVVASRFKYALVAAAGALGLYLVAGATSSGVEGIAADARAIFQEQANPAGLVHILSMGIVIVTAVRGRHIIEAISWGLIAAIAFNIVFRLAPLNAMLVFRAPENWAVAQTLSGLPIVELVPAGDASVGGSIYSGAAGYFTMSILILLIIAGAQVMIRGGAFQALQNFLLRVVARTVRRAELTMVLSTALINAAITINTAAEIAIAPYIGTIGKRFNLNGYRRANILDANTSALGYIFPWSGGVLVGYSAMAGLTDQYAWFTQDMIVSPPEVFFYVFHGWLLVILFILAAVTGFGREYMTDRVAQRSAQI